MLDEAYQNAVVAEVVEHQQPSSSNTSTPFACKMFVAVVAVLLVYSIVMIYSRKRASKDSTLAPNSFQNLDTLKKAVDNYLDGVRRVIGEWDVSKVTSMDDLFSSKRSR